MAQSPSRETDSAAELIATRLTLGGHVQGVGFRPFVYRRAQDLGLRGTVRNLRGEVEIVAFGTAVALAAFREALIADAPPLARPVIVSESACAITPPKDFRILASDATAAARISVPPDYFTCDACLDELYTATNRRYGYPFINCTQCGPRYTLIEALPYDRANTTMAIFPMCAPCRAEYENPLDRRFHAEPIACPSCGPQLQYHDPSTAPAPTDPMTAAVDAVLAGQVIAVKGVGGYHLVCDAGSDAAVTRLRHKKRRPDKPLAVMFPVTGVDGLDSLREHVHVSDSGGHLLASPARPIVLLPRRASSSLATGLAPGLRELGVFLPYSPLHSLLLHRCGRPLVATSGNRSGEPVLIDNEGAERYLHPVVDGFLHHDRPIARPADDSVYRVIDGAPRPLRLGRGSAPVERDLAQWLPEPVIAVGGHQKTTVALAWDDRVVMSPHIGDMHSVRSAEVFAQVVADLQTLYGVRAARVLCDSHPGYTTHRWARQCGLPLTTIAHHCAHASALIGDVGPLNNAAPCLVLTWDGVGYGRDGTLWGGETFFGSPGHWRRVASLRPFSLPGGERAGREPWRSAAALCWETGRDYRPGRPLDELAFSAWQRRLNAPATSAVGRLFDGFAALAAGIMDVSYEGQAPMQLEALCAGAAAPLRLPFAAADPGGLCRVDWEPLLGLAVDDTRPVGERALAFHLSLADCIVRQAVYFRNRLGVQTVGLTGGVFQNRVLSEAAINGLVQRDFGVLVAKEIPCNDGGLSFGQVVEFAAANAANHGRRP